MTGALDSDIGLVPTAFVAVTKHSYACPLVNPETVIDEVELASKKMLSQKQ